MAEIQQLEIDFLPGLLEQLSRKLADNPADPVYFPARRLPELIEATGDLRVIYWLTERFLEKPDAKRRRAIDQLAGLLPHLHALLKQAQQDEPVKKR